MSLKKTLMKQAMKLMQSDTAMKLMQSDTAMKLMQNPKVMNTVMQAFTLKGKIEGAVTGASEKIATTMGFATKEEVQKLRAIIQDLENQLEHEQSQRTVERPVD